MKYPDSDRDWTTIAVRNARVRKEVRVIRDALCCDLLNVTPREILHIQLAHESGMGQMNLPAGVIKHVRL